MSIVRRELVEELLQAFSKLELNVLLLSTGPFAASHILKQVNFYGSQLQFDGHDITLSDAGHWDEYRYVPSAKSEFPLKIDIEPIAEQFLLAYAAAFQLALYPRLEPVYYQWISFKGTSKISDKSRSSTLDWLLYWECFLCCCWSILSCSVSTIRKMRSSLQP